ncbi:hypothetical protein BS50DRAFT_631285 [Corynespora cassiicola Philippines]|uniref:Uncharacterized protein n=1 Tax=Corynespora cassiicola Philippines TaxID=1448308 RepID=A0A2T2P1B8_CORCC|nr:hypothetical protein BS50DRAFT_631285 [Corynespora cassiicola Philippines]
MGWSLMGSMVRLVDDRYKRDSPQRYRLSNSRWNSKWWLFGSAPPVGETSDDEGKVVSDDGRGLDPPGGENSLKEGKVATGDVTTEEAAVVTAGGTRRDDGREEAPGNVPGKVDGGTSPDNEAVTVIIFVVVTTSEFVSGASPERAVDVMELVRVPNLIEQEDRAVGTEDSPYSLFDVLEAVRSGTLVWMVKIGFSVASPFDVVEAVGSGTLVWMVKIGFLAPPLIVLDRVGISQPWPGVIDDGLTEPVVGIDAVGVLVLTVFNVTLGDTEPVAMVPDVVRIIELTSMDPDIVGTTELASTTSCWIENRFSGQTNACILEIDLVTSRTLGCVTSLG